MAYLHARSNVCRSGVTHAGLVNHPMALTMGGTSRKGDTLQGIKYTVTIPLDGGPSTCTLRVQGTKPAVGQDLLIAFGGETWWGGTVMAVKAVTRAQLVHYDVQAIDWRWLLDRYLPVSAVYDGIGINTAVHQLLNAFTNGGFRGGYLPSSLGDVGRVEFADTPVVECLQRFARMANAGAGAFLRIRPDKQIDIGTSFPDGVAPTWTNSSAYRDIAWEETLHQVRTRTYARGRSTTVSATVPAGSTTIPLDECHLFSAAGGSAYVGIDQVAYTGVSAASGPGSLTGVTGIDVDIAQGASIRVAVEVNDSAAQTALATVLGGGRSGVVSHVLGNDAWTLAEATARATADVAYNKAAAQAVAYTVIAASAVVRTHLPGAIVTATVSSPLTISGSFRIQAVTIVPFDTQASATDPFLSARVTAGSISRQQLADRLVQAKGSVQ